jgi:hypothetical protein
MAMLFNTFLPAPNQLLYAIKTSNVWLCTQPTLHRVSYVLVTSKPSSSKSFFQRSKKVKIRWCQIWTVSWMFHESPLQFPECLQHVGCSMGMGIVMLLQDALWHSSSPVTIGSTCDSCSTFQALDENPRRWPTSTCLPMAVFWIST